MILKKAGLMIMVFGLLAFSTLVVPLLISGNASAHAPTAIYPTYKEGTLTVYINHASDDPDSHYIKTVTVTVNRLEVLSETYTSQKVDDAKGMVTYSYTVAAIEEDVISVTAECSIGGTITETLTVGVEDPKEDPKSNYTDKEYPDKDKYPNKDGDPDQKGDSDQEYGTTLLLYGAIAGVLIVIIVLVAMLIPKKKDATKNGTSKTGKTKNDDWTTCPKCGTDLKMKDLSSHLDSVHPKLSKTAKEKMMERVTKQNRTTELEYYKERVD